MNRTNRVVKSARNRNKGMTLVEIMIVIAIIGLVMGAVVVGAFPAFKKAQCKTAWTETQSVLQAVTAYMTDHDGECPGNIKDLVTGKYLSKDPVDPWGKQLVLECPGKEGRDADVISTGENKAPGGMDVLSWEPQTQCNLDKAK